jgi:hypothetical protein
MKVLVIPEDQELDRYIVKPVVEALFADLEIPARVEVLPEPRLRGATDALDPSMVEAIVRDNPMEDLFLLIVDRDCNRQRNEDKARMRESEHAGKLIACVAIQEVEVWMLALHRDALAGSMSAIREHCDPKEEWAEPLLTSLGTDGPGRGRKRAMRAIKGRWRSLRSTCNELEALQERIRAWHAAPRT